MPPGDEVTDTVLVLAFYDDEPACESWDVHYRFSPKRDADGKTVVSHYREGELERIVESRP